MSWSSSSCVHPVNQAVSKCRWFRRSMKTLCTRALHFDYVMNSCLLGSNRADIDVLHQQRESKAQQQTNKKRANSLLWIKTCTYSYNLTPTRGIKCLCILQHPPTRPSHFNIFPFARCAKSDEDCVCWGINFAFYYILKSAPEPTKHGLEEGVCGWP